jgi:hypothetical protein
MARAVGRPDGRAHVDQDVVDRAHERRGMAGRPTRTIKIPIPVRRCSSCEDSRLSGGLRRVVDGEIAA